MNHSAALTLVNGLGTVQAAPDPVKLSLLTRVVGWLESNYGTGWSGDGAGSHNWGAITGTYQGAYFTAQDSKPGPDGQVTYTTKFRKYPDDRAAAEDLARLLQSRYSAAVAAVPDWPAVARNLYGYYLGFGSKEQAIAAWAGRATSIAKSIVAATGEALPASPSSAPSPAWLLAGIAAVAAYLLRKRNA